MSIVIIPQGVILSGVQPAEIQGQVDFAVWSQVINATRVSSM
jgi:hypothetical protein